ncbi:MAG: hypothetical protein AAFV37_09010 [Pseudomonadota bacterium]|mgnify:CR=1 FL=1
MRALPILAASIALMLCDAPTVSADTNTEKKVGYLSLSNFGSYNIDPVVLHWKTPEGEKKSKKLGAKIGGDEALCYDIEKANDVPDGSEIWLVGKIEGGENENCRKDSKHYYEKGSSKAWFQYMAGTTLNNNSCKNDPKGPGSYDASTTVKGNSALCESLQSY